MKNLTTNLSATDGRIFNGTEVIGSYEFDFNADCFWVSNLNGPGQISFETKDELINYFI